MASLDIAMEDLAIQIGTWLLPYQPNIPILYPNTRPTAGQIPATLIARGYPIQTHVMKRLENKMAQVSVYDAKDGTVFPFVERFPVQVNYTSPGDPAHGVPASGNELWEVAREKKRFVVDIYASDADKRQSICDLLRVLLRDAYRLRHADGTLTLLKYLKQESEDYEQVDTVYVRDYIFEADISETITVDATQVLKIQSTVKVGPPLAPNTLNTETM